jgi:hypothetical protein
MLHYHFLDDDPELSIQFSKGIKLDEYLEFHNNTELARKTELEIFSKTMGIDAMNIHYLSSKRFYYNGFKPTLNVNGRYYSVPHELLNKIYKIESLVYKFFYEKTLSVKQKASLNVYDFEGELLLNMHKDEFGDIYKDSITFYSIKPYGRFELIKSKNNVVFAKTLYHPAVEWHQTCSKYYDNGVLESKGVYEKGLRKGNWDYYTYEGEKYMQVKFKFDNEIKKKLFEISKEEINEY